MVGTEPEYNIRIYTGKFGDDGGALLVVDVDVKEGKNGYENCCGLNLTDGICPKPVSCYTVNWTALPLSC